LVIGLASANGSSAFFTQTFLVPLNGLMNDRYVPSGDNCDPEISGSPKKSARSITGGCPLDCAEAMPLTSATAAPHHTTHERTRTMLHTSWDDRLQSARLQATRTVGPATRHFAGTLHGYAGTDGRVRGG
jgi:hypothetical protein